MKLPYFVSASALLLAGWLGLTFVHEVSPQQYPKQRTGISTAQARHAALKPLVHPLKQVIQSASGRSAVATH